VPTSLFHFAQRANGATHRFAVEAHDGAHDEVAGRHAVDRKAAECDADVIVRPYGERHAVIGNCRTVGGGGEFERGRDHAILRNSIQLEGNRMLPPRQAMSLQSRARCGSELSWSSA